MEGYLEKKGFPFWKQSYFRLGRKALTYGRKPGDEDSTSIKFSGKITVSKDDKDTRTFLIRYKDKESKKVKEKELRLRASDEELCDLWIAMLEPFQKEPHPIPKPVNQALLMAMKYLMKKAKTVKGIFSYKYMDKRHTDEPDKIIRLKTEILLQVLSGSDAIPSFADPHTMCDVILGLLRSAPSGGVLTKKKRKDAMRSSDREHLKGIFQKLPPENFEIVKGASALLDTLKRSGSSTMQDMKIFVAALAQIKETMVVEGSADSLTRMLLHEYKYFFSNDHHDLSGEDPPSDPAKNDSIWKEKSRSKFSRGSQGDEDGLASVRNQQEKTSHARSNIQENSDDHPRGRSKLGSSQNKLRTKMKEDSKGEIEPIDKKTAKDKEEEIPVVPKKSSLDMEDFGFDEDFGTGDLDLGLSDDEPQIDDEDDNEKSKAPKSEISPLPADEVGSDVNRKQAVKTTPIVAKKEKTVKTPLDTPDKYERKSQFSFPASSSPAEERDVKPSEVEEKVFRTQEKDDDRTTDADDDELALSLSFDDVNMSDIATSPAKSPFSQPSPVSPRVRKKPSITRIDEEKADGDQNSGKKKARAVSAAASAVDDDVDLDFDPTPEPDNEPERDFNDDDDDGRIAALTEERDKAWDERDQALTEVRKLKRQLARGAGNIEIPPKNDDDKITILKDELNLAQTKRDEARDERDKARDERNKAQAELHQVKQDLEKANEKLRESKSKMQNVKQKLAKLKDNLDAKDQKLSNFQSQVKALEKMVGNKEKKEEKLRSEVQAARAEIEVLNENLEDLRKQRKISEEEVERLRRDLQSVGLEKSGPEKELAVAKAEAADLRRDLSKIEAQLEKEKGCAERLAKENKQLKELVKQSEEAKKNSETKAKGLESSVLKKKEREFEALKIKLREAEKERERAENLAESRAHEIESVKKELEVEREIVFKAGDGNAKNIIVEELRQAHEALKARYATVMQEHENASRRLAGEVRRGERLAAELESRKDASTQDVQHAQRETLRKETEIEKLKLRLVSANRTIDELKREIGVHVRAMKGLEARPKGKVGSPRLPISPSCGESSFSPGTASRPTLYTSSRPSKSDRIQRLDRARERLKHMAASAKTKLEEARRRHDVIRLKVDSRPGTSHSYLQNR